MNRIMLNVLFNSSQNLKQISFFSMFIIRKRRFTYYWTNRYTKLLLILLNFEILSIMRHCRLYNHTIEDLLGRRAYFKKLHFAKIILKVLYLSRIKINKQYFVKLF